MGHPTFYDGLVGKRARVGLELELDAGAAGQVRCRRHLIRAASVRLPPPARPQLCTPAPRPHTPHTCTYTYMHAYTTITITISDVCMALCVGTLVHVPIE
jgi:hypothetical protein